MENASQKAQDFISKAGKIMDNLAALCAEYGIAEPNKYFLIPYDKELKQFRLFIALDQVEKSIASGLKGTTNLSPP